MNSVPRIADIVFDELNNDDCCWSEDVIAILNKHREHFVGVSEESQADGIYIIFWDDYSCNQIEIPFGVIINVKAGNYSRGNKELNS
jgi:hypothetical protein